MDDMRTGSQQNPDSAPEVGEDAASSVGPAFPPVMSLEERQELQEELIKVEDEIQTLSQVLAAKERLLADIKRKLGITPLNELKQNISRTWQDVTTSMAYKRTSETLSQAGQKATTAFSSVGSAITRKLEDVRNAQTFKSLEERVGTLKTKITPSAGGATDEDSGAAPSESLLNPPEALPTQETPMH